MTRILQLRQPKNSRNSNQKNNLNKLFTFIKVLTEKWGLFVFLSIYIKNKMDGLLGLSEFKKNTKKCQDVLILSTDLIIM